MVDESGEGSQPGQPPAEAADPNVVGPEEEYKGTKYEGMTDEEKRAHLAGLAGVLVSDSQEAGTSQGGGMDNRHVTGSGMVVEQYPRQKYKEEGGPQGQDTSGFKATAEKVTSVLGSSASGEPEAGTPAPNTGGNIGGGSGEGTGSAPTGGGGQA